MSTICSRLALLLAVLVLCGFEPKPGDPALRAREPFPAPNEQHADADSGTLSLTWVALAGVVSHQVYFGTSQQAVAEANPKSPEFRGKVTATSYAPGPLSPLAQYFWRVDEVDDKGQVTPGEVWSFRPRRVAFPEAEGYGRFAIGGRGGRVIEVTNLKDSGPGSLRAAVEAEGPRTVVFAVSGLITLESKLVIRNPYLTIAGQTAPGKGIAIRKYTFGMLGGKDVVVRHIRVRPGDISGKTLDGMGMTGSDDCIFDHCSISWTLDEAFSSRQARNITLQRTMISEALNVAGHRKYPPGSQHGYAASIGGQVGSFHHNLLAHNSGRNWSLAGGIDRSHHFIGWLDIRNNVVYNWQNRTTDGGAEKVNFVNNYYQPGPASKVFHLLKPERTNIGKWGRQDYYVSGNVMVGHVKAEDALGGVIQPDPSTAKLTGDYVVDHDDDLPKRFEPFSDFIKDKPFFEPYVETQTAALAYKMVLSDVGANRPGLDDHDLRIINETLTGTAKYKGNKTKLPGIPDSQEDVGGWENYPEVHRPDKWDSDHDGLPDWWETKHGTSPASSAGDFSDANADRDGNGFTDLEDYLAWMAKPHLITTVNKPVEIDVSQLSRGFAKKPVYVVRESRHGEVTLLPDGKTARFVPASGYKGSARFVATVTDADGDSLATRVSVVIQ